MKGRVLVIAGSDSGAGAGIQADLKTVMALGGYATTAITALTAQNTLGIHGIRAVEPDFVIRQIEAVLDDIGADCIKIGMLYSVEIIRAVAKVLEAKAPQIPLVVDPILVAKGGTVLLDAWGIAALKDRILPKATLFTPNVPEAGAFTALPINNLDQMREAAIKLLALGPQSVLLKGGHLPGDTLYDVLATRESTTVFENLRIDTPHTHGTGCTLASAIATGIAQGMAIAEAVARARKYLQETIRHAPRLGGGHGPLNHGVKESD